MHYDYSYQFDPFSSLFSLALTALYIVGLWFCFLKAGRHGWAAIIPFYSTYVVIKVANRPGWWLIWYFIPIANIIVGIIVALDFGRLFGKGGAFSFFLLFLIPVIGLPIVGFGKAVYSGPRPGQAPPLAAGEVRI